MEITETEKAGLQIIGNAEVIIHLMKEIKTLGIGQIDRWRKEEIYYETTNQLKGILTQIKTINKNQGGK